MTQIMETITITSDREEYGRNHGGQKKVVFGDGEYIFIYT
jgi:hypothetical protein